MLNCCAPDGTSTTGPTPAEKAYSTGGLREATVTQRRGATPITCHMRSFLGHCSSIEAFSCDRNALSVLRQICSVQSSNMSPPHATSQNPQQQPSKESPTQEDQSQDQRSQPALARREKLRTKDSREHVTLALDYRM
ncbi:hypothetical protein BAUCODRAFT_282993 [Baudoinia panamericana UAMH 10762]|uniref:Uncharacterized protein n=1 Tax=Baudoinia panamericana (strain UAMH 10762) TaxID=717646 RepID=M2MLG7_BAUPA|nr:uncharacterized protein BAUCODRAFT_282993 [Baudoinia panamericana UAMH 10762]EMC92238.1 hypothetical protein BAUCODRAFT_282993 [Baudoinia panamericana UAMH 10762]